MKGFWEKLSKPFFVLAPMEDVTDTVFRQMVVGLGRPEVFFTEFTNVDGIEFAVRNTGADFASIPVLQRLQFSEVERPIVAQIWGKDPEKFYKAAKVVAELKFDGVDINLACPVRAVLKMGCGGALIGQNSQVKEIVAAVKDGVGKLPISVKTRLGNKGVITEDWIGFLLTLDITALTIHGRTVAEKSEVPAHWEEIGKAVKLRNESNNRTLIIGNGDVKSLDEAREKSKKYGVDGVMIGRGIFENVAVFDKLGHKLTPQEKMAALLAHVKLFEKTWGDRKNFQVIKKFVKAYVNGFEGASDMRVKLMGARGVAELLACINLLLQKL